MTRTIQAILCHILKSVSVVAFANQFHVHGGLYDALVEKTHLYDGYMADDKSQLLYLQEE